MSYIPLIVIVSVVLFLYLVLRTPRFWKDVEGLIEDLTDYASVFETVPLSPGEIGLHLRSKRCDVQYHHGVNRDGSISFESIRFEKGGGFRFRVSYGIEGIVSFERSGQERDTTPRLAHSQLSLLLDLRDLVRAQLAHRNR